MAPFVIETVGWEFLFYGSSLLGCLWCLFFLLLVGAHPDEASSCLPLLKTSRYEANYIRINKGEDEAGKEGEEGRKKAVPWGRILTHGGVLAYCCYTFACTPSLLSMSSYFSYSAYSSYYYSFLSSSFSLLCFILLPIHEPSSPSMNPSF